MDTTTKKRTTLWLTWLVATAMLLVGAYPIVKRQQPRTPDHSSAPVTYSH